MGPFDDSMRRWLEEHRRLIERFLAVERALPPRWITDELAEMRRVQEQARAVSDQLRAVVDRDRSLVLAAQGIRSRLVLDQVLESAVLAREALEAPSRMVQSVADESRRISDMVRQASAPWFGFDPAMMAVVEDWTERVVASLPEDRGGEVTLEEVAKASTEQLDAIPKSQSGRISFLQLVILIVTIYFGLAHQASSKQAHADALRSIDVQQRAGEHTEVNTEAIDRLLRATIAAGYLGTEILLTHEVTRRRHLREAGRSSAASLEVLERGTGVGLVMRSDGWAAVVVESPEGLVVGWMDSRYLRPYEVESAEEDGDQESPSLN